MAEDPAEKYKDDLDTDEYDFGDLNPVTVQLCTDADADRVAKAIWDSLYMNPWETAGEIGREYYLDLARIAVRAYWKGRGF